MSFEIVDIHPHIISNDEARYPSKPLRGKQSTWSAERPQTFEQLVAEMDAAAVAKAAIVQASTYYGFDNSYVADSIARDPTRFTGVCTVNVFADDAIRVIEGWLAKGFSGIRIFTGGATHANDTSLLDDERSYPVWEYAGANGVPIAVQTGPEGLPSVRKLLERFPATKLVLDHVGRPRLDDGPPYEAARSLFELASYSNAYLKCTPRTMDLSRSGASTPAAFFGALVEAFRSDRIAYGSNLPANEGPMTRLIDDAKACLSSLSGADQEMILGGTAKTLYPRLA